MNVSVSQKIRLALTAVAVFATVCMVGYLLYRGFLYKREEMQSRFQELHNIVSNEDSNDDQSSYQQDTTNAENNGDVSNDTSGSLSWKMLSKTEMNFTNTQTEQELNPNYSPELIALNSHDVSIKGFMFPLDAKGKQTHFLLSPYAPSCPFCMPAGASELIEVHPTDPVSIYGKSIMVKGQLELLTKQSDLEGGMLYRINHASVE